MTDIVGNETVRSLWDGLVAACGDRVFLRFRDRADATSTYTYRAFNEEIDRTANVFLSMGVQAGERVCVQLCTCPEFMMCLFGLAKIGAVMVPMNEQNLVEEAAYVLDRTGATCALVEPKFLDLYRAVRAEGPYLPKGVLVARTAEEGVEGLGEALAALSQDDALRDFSQLRAAAAPELDEVRPLSADDPVEIIFTSGTTSRPKGVVLTHANILFSGLYGDWEVTLTRDDRLLTTMPACHSNFQLAALMPVLTAGAELIVVEKYSARRFWSQIREFGATVTQCVAMMLRTLMLQPASPDDRNHTLREMLYFLPVSDAEKAAFEERFGVRLMNTYGSTESIGWVLTDPPAGPRRWPSVGRAGLGYEVRIMREDGVQAAPGEIGEIQVHGQRGRTIMKEYFNDPEATARTFTDDGWLQDGRQGLRGRGRLVLLRRPQGEHDQAGGGEHLHHRAGERAGGPSPHRGSGRHRRARPHPRPGGQGVRAAVRRRRAHRGGRAFVLRGAHGRLQGALVRGDRALVPAHVQHEDREAVVALI